MTEKKWTKIGAIATIIGVVVAIVALTLPYFDDDLKARISPIDGPNIEGQSIPFSSIESHIPNEVKITSSKWDFGDGNNANDQIVHHTYQKSGDYTVTLKIVDDKGRTSQDQTIVTVKPKIDVPKKPIFCPLDKVLVNGTCEPKLPECNSNEVLVNDKCESKSTLADTDGDGIDDSKDNCPEWKNPDQKTVI